MIIIMPLIITKKCLPVLTACARLFSVDCKSGCTCRSDGNCAVLDPNLVRKRKEKTKKKTKIRIRE